MWRLHHVAWQLLLVLPYLDSTSDHYPFLPPSSLAFSLPLNCICFIEEVNLPYCREVRVRLCQGSY